MRNVLLVASDGVAWPTLQGMLHAMPEARVIGEASNAADALDIVTGLEPDVVIAPSEIQGESSLDLIRALHERCPRAAIVVLAARFHVTDLAELAQAGVRSYLLWPDMDVDLLKRCLSVAILGDVMLGSARVGEAFFEAMRGNSSISTVTQLTPREQSVLSLLAADLSDKEIASRLHVSASTIRSHIQDLCVKLEVNTRFGLAISGVMRGLIPMSQ